MKVDQKKLAETLKMARVFSGLSQVEMSKTHGITAAFLSALETGIPVSGLLFVTEPESTESDEVVDQFSDYLNLMESRKARKEAPNV